MCVRTIVSHKWGERKSNGGLETEEGNRQRSPPIQTQIAFPTRENRYAVPISSSPTDRLMFLEVKACHS